jgi:hypothetical protein
MSQFFDDLEAQLHAAARDQADARRAADRPRSRWRAMRSGTRAIPVALAAAVTVIVVVIALTLHAAPHAHSGAPSSHPGPAPRPAATSSFAPRTGRSSVALPMTATPLGHMSPQQQHELQYVFTAQAKAMKSSACGARPLVRPTVLHGRPPATLMSMLGVLRRPATPADTLDIPHTSRPLLPQQATDIYIDYNRRARVKDGVSYYLTPVGRIVSPALFSARCAAEQKTVLRSDLPQIPAAQRASTLALQARLLPIFMHGGQAPSGAGVCITDMNAMFSGSGACESAVQIAKGAPAYSDGSTLIGLAPDGVASVSLHYSSAHGLPAATVTTDVVANLYAVAIPRVSDPNGGFPSDITWRSASGQVIKTISTG